MATKGENTIAYACETPAFAAITIDARKMPIPPAMGKAILPNPLCNLNFTRDTSFQLYETSSP